MTRNSGKKVQFCPDWQLQKRHGLQVLFDYRVHDHLEDNLDVGGVGCCGEVVVDEFVRGGVERDKGGGDEADGRVHIAVCTWRGDEGRVRLDNQTSGSFQLKTDEMCL